MKPVLIREPASRCWHGRALLIGGCPAPPTPCQPHATCPGAIHHLKITFSLQLAKLQSSETALLCADAWVTTNKGSVKDPQGAGSRDNCHPAGSANTGQQFLGSRGGCCSCGEEGHSWNACRRDENATPFCVQGLRYNTMKLTTGRQAKRKLFSHKFFGEGGGKIMFLGKA